MSDQQQGRIARTLTLSVTYAIKLVGLAAAFNQLLLQKDPHAFPLAIAAFMMAGAQVSEGLVLSFLDRLMRDGEGPPPRPVEERHT